MLYIINNFEFDSTNLILTKSGEVIDIRHNEAKLLSLLLEQSKKVLSKEDILSHVWKDKVVSEQAVFQNISHLRGLFGSDAIKTFPKRGYQWQLNSEKTPQALSLADCDTDLSNAGNSNNDTKTSINKNNSTKILRLFAVLTSFVVLFIMVYLGNDISDKKVDSRINLAYIPFKNSKNTTHVKFEDNRYFNFTSLSHIDTSTFKKSAELEYPHLAKTHPLVMSGELHKYNQQFFLDFQIKGPFGNWQGQLSASSQNILIRKLQHHLQQTFIYELLNQAQPLELKQAKLSIAHQENPTDLINLGNLISVYIEMEDLEKAMVMANKLENVAIELKKPQQIGNALLYQSNILTRKELYELSTHKLTKAISKFEQIADLKRQADAWYEKSWLDHLQRDYSTVKATLLKAAELSVAAEDIERELDALFYLSVMAHKHRQEIDKYKYLQQAENKMTSYQLPSYQFARVPFHYAIFARTAEDKEPHYKQVLKLAALIPANWVAQTSRKYLVQHYIETNRLEEAQVLINNLSTPTSNKSYLEALLAQAKNQQSNFNRLAKHAFEQAQLAGDRRLSLDVALLLCSKGQIEAQVNYDFYAQYIREKANKYWRQDNKEELLALNL
jgi:DNA-binding winged helix-turn-helix (wHTH) protein